MTEAANQTRAAGAFIEGLASSGPFMHQPREAMVNSEYPEQLWFTDVCGVNHVYAPRRVRIDGGEVWIHSFRGDTNATIAISAGPGTAGVKTECRVALTPEALRELARCCIDAAASIDAEMAAHAEVPA